LGNCFQAAGRYLMNNNIQNSNLRLVHGLVTGQAKIEGFIHDHAWVEDGDMVIDKSNGNDFYVPKKLYYHLGNIEEFNLTRYNWEEMTKQLVATKHWGPWPHNPSI